METTTINEWIDRTQNLLDVQKDLCLETIQASFTRPDLVELRMILNFAKEKLPNE